MAEGQLTLIPTISRVFEMEDDVSACSGAWELYDLFFTRLIERAQAVGERMVIAIDQREYAALIYGHEAARKNWVAVEDRYAPAHMAAIRDERWVA